MLSSDIFLENPLTLYRVRNVQVDRDSLQGVAVFDEFPPIRRPVVTLQNILVVRRKRDFIHFQEHEEGLSLHCATRVGVEHFQQLSNPRLHLVRLLLVLG